MRAHRIACQPILQLAAPGQRPPQRQHLARAGGPERHLGEQPLQIQNLAPASCAVPPRRIALPRQLAHRIQPRFDLFAARTHGRSSRCRSSRPPMPVQV